MHRAFYKIHYGAYYGYGQYHRYRICVGAFLVESAFFKKRHRKHTAARAKYTVHKTDRYAEESGLYVFFYVFQANHQNYFDRLNIKNAIVIYKNK